VHSSPQSLAYLGWHGRGNLGDDAIRAGVTASLPGTPLVDAPLYPRDLARVVRSGNVRALRRSLPFLGGGTCVGRRNWRVHVWCGLALARQRPALAVGVGVEDPAFSGRNSFSDEGELRRWRGVLRNFDRVTVRGPRSAELLADVGVDATVVGDPALALERPLGDVDEERIGINLGFGDDLWGHDPEAVSDVVSTSCRDLVRRGYRVVGLAANAEDVPLLRRTFERAGIVAEVELPHTPDEFSANARRCALVVTMRLHAAVLAALAGTPTVMLEYQPKCRDFARSIGSEQHLVRTDGLSAGTFVDGVLALLDNRAAEAARIDAAVDELRERLASEFGRANAVSAAR
jgi:polysaccharide pyruvyl transferase WcaK-like protein